MKIESKIQFTGNNDEEVKDFIGPNRIFEQNEHGDYFIKYEYYEKTNALLVHMNDYILKLKDDYNKIYFISMNENTYKNNESILKKVS